MPQPPINALTLRPMVEADLPQVVAIEEASYYLPWAHLMFHEALVSPQQHAWVLSQGEEVVAYCVVALIVDEADLLNLAVKPCWRRRGLAQQLLTHACEQVQALSMERFFLEVNVENTAAQQLYLALGFQPVGRRKGYYSTATGPKDALVMCLEFETKQHE